MCNTAMWLDGLKYLKTLLETKNAKIVEKIDIRTMPFRDSFSAMFGVIVYCKKFLNLSSMPASLLLQNLLQPRGVNLHRDYGHSGLRRGKSDGAIDTFGEFTRRKARDKKTDTSRDGKLHRSILAGGSNGTTLDESLLGMLEATKTDRKAGYAEITDPQKISNRAAEFVAKAREKKFAKEELIDRYEKLVKSQTRNTGNPVNHNTTFYEDMPAVERELKDAAISGDSVVIQAEGNCGG